MEKTSFMSKPIINLWQVVLTICYVIGCFQSGEVRGLINFLFLIGFTLSLFASKKYVEENK